MSCITMNKNSESLLRWIFRRTDSLECIGFFFISVSNANNARYGPLFEPTQNVRLVYLRGLNLKYSDRILLYIFRKIPILFRKKIKKYKLLHLFSLSKWPATEIQVLHVDDPEYSTIETDNLIKWEKNLIGNFAIPILICTNEFSYTWYRTILKKTKIMIIEQGFPTLKVKQTIKNIDSFTCVYSSPYIHYRGDKHGLHSTWGADILIDEIIPKLFNIDPSIKVLLIGELGKCAKKALSEYKNWNSVGRVSFDKNQTYLSGCDLGLYPRLFDHKRSILKIMSYLGAGLPVVTFDLVDTNIIKKYDLGPVVNNVEEFTLSIVKLKNTPELIDQYKRKVNEINSNYTWESLSKKMEAKIEILKK